MAIDLLTRAEKGAALSATDNDVNLTTIQTAVNANETAIALKAPLASPTFTGTPSAPTAAPGTNTTQLATMAALQAAILAALSGFTFKESVRVKSTGNVVIATALENGDTLNGVVLATGNRVLLAAQTAPAENGIYIVPASGAASRSTDADTWDKLVSAFLTVEEGTASADTAWYCTINTGGTLNTTAVTWSLFPTAGGGTAGGTTFSPTGGISATDVQAALAELDAEKTGAAATITSGSVVDVVLEQVLVTISGNTTLTAAAHQGRTLFCTAACSLTVNSSTDFAAGKGCNILAEGGIVTIVATATVNRAGGKPLTIPRYDGASLTRTNTADVYMLFGGMA